MINRRTFAALLAGTVAAPKIAVTKSAWSQPVTKKTVYYASVGPELTLYDIDVADAALQKRGTVTLPANVQYAWPHPSQAISLRGVEQRRPGRARRRQAPGERVPHRSGLGRADAARRAADAAVAPDPRQRRSRRRISCSPPTTTRATSRCIASTRDGTLGDAVSQPGKPDAGIYGHQILTTPGNQTAIFVARGNNAAGGKPEDPGALKVYGFKSGVLTNIASIQPGTGLGFGPRHIDFHPTQPWVYVSVERQNKLYVYALQADGRLGRDPIFMKETLADPANVKPAQGAGPIHVHPNGRFVYHHQPQCRPGRLRRQEGLERRREQRRGVLDRSADRRADLDPDHRAATATICAISASIRADACWSPPASRRCRCATATTVKTLPAGVIVYRVGGDGKLDIRAQVRRRDRRAHAVLERDGDAGVAADAGSEKSPARPPSAHVCAIDGLGVN